MATPTYATVLSQINTYIVANGNNDITANVLNPILELILDFANNTIGDLEDLTTDENSTVVAALNSLVQNILDITNGSVKLHTGYDDPNVTPPASYNYADFFMQLDPLDESPIKLWQWNGFEWLDYSEVPSTNSDNIQNNSDVAGSSVTDALNNLNSISGLQDGLEFVANGTDNFIDIGVTTKPTGAFLDSVILRKADWSFSGTTVTFTFTPIINSIIQFV